MGQLRLIQTHVCLVAVMLAAPCAAAAQTTSDGVRAFLRGDYQAAARILQPLADAVPEPDPLAQYFMAMLYDSGRGVMRDIPITLTGIVGWLAG
jgi:TPR repeat protein